MLNLSKVIPDIFEHFKLEFPNEGCGLLYTIKGKLYWKACRNISKSPHTQFEIEPSELIQTKKLGNIVGIVHSHINESCKPSLVDIESCYNLKIPFYIFSFPDMSMYFLAPESQVPYLYGREYIFGIQDCFEATKDYLNTKDILIPPRDNFMEDWESKGLNYFSEDNIKKWNHKKVENNMPEINDVLIFSVESNVPNHCAVYIGEDTIFHHAINRLSCSESIYPFWHKYLTGVYRYEA